MLPRVASSVPRAWLLCLLVFAASLLGVRRADAGDHGQDSGESRQVATVIRVVDQQYNPNQGGSQLLLLELEDGKHITVANSIPPGHTVMHVTYEAGDRVVVLDAPDGVFVEGYYRAGVLGWILALFVGLIMLVGAGRGGRSLGSLLVIGSLLIMVLVPILVSGIDPLLATSVFCVLATFLTIVIVGGWNLKSLAACLGTATGVILAGFLGAWAIEVAHIRGIYDIETQSLLVQYPNVDVTLLITSGIIIGALGAAMDVGMSVASSLQEVHQANPSKSLKELYDAGMNVGRDIMGTMINTLILAYAGSSLPTIILISQMPPVEVLNNELIAKEIIFSVVGSIGLILTIPVTAIISSYLYKKYQ